MGYSSGFLNHRIMVKRKVEKEGSMGRNSSKYEFEDVVCLWANYKFNKGVKAMHEGALDAYDTVMFRTRWTPDLTRDSFIECEGVIYQVISFNADKIANEIQITATEVNVK